MVARRLVRLRCARRIRQRQPVPLPFEGPANAGSRPLPGLPEGGSTWSRMRPISSRRVFRSRGGLLRNSIELQRHPGQALQQRVVKVAGDALRSARRSFVEQAQFGRHLPQSQPVQKPHQPSGRQRAESLEPEGLVIRRRDAEIPAGAGLVPDAVVIAGNDAEAVLLRREAAVVGSAPASSRIPSRSSWPSSLYRKWTRSGIVRLSAV